MENRSHSTAALAVLAVVALAASAPRATRAQSGVTHSPPPAAAPRPGTFQTVLAGVTPDGQGSVWEGHADGVAPGRVRLELRQDGPPSEAANLIWRVRARWTLDAGEARSFDADLEGVVVWQAHLVRLAGTISSGWMAGARLEQVGRVVNGDISGSFTIIP